MNNAKHDRARCDKINAIRLAAGNAGMHCPTCAQKADRPHSRHDARGHVIEGCVDAFHSGHVYGEVARWWSRPAAQGVRAHALVHLETL